MAAPANGLCSMKNSSLSRELSLNIFNEKDSEKGAESEQEHLVASKNMETSALDLDTEPTGKRIFKRAAVALFAVATIGLVVANSSRTKYQDESSPTVTQGFVNLAESQYATVPSWIKRPKPAVCNAAIVIERCLQLNGLHPGAYDGDINSPKAVVNSSVLADFWMVSESSVKNYLTSIGFTLAKTKSVSVKCKDLCEKTMASFPPGSVPAVSDVGCFFYKSKQPYCVIDVALGIIMNTHMPKGNRDKLQRQFHRHAHPKLTHGEKGDDSEIDDELHPTPKEKKDYVERIFWAKVPVHEMAYSAARLFRVFPASPNVTLDLDISGEGEKVKEKGTANAHAVEGCKTVEDGYCDAPYSCAPGTDNVDCGKFNATEIPDDSCTYSNDGQCDEIKFCEKNTDCTDCQTCGFGGEKLAKALSGLQPDDSCENARDGTCDTDGDLAADAKQCEDDTDCTDCNTCTYTHHFTPPQWEFMVLQTGLRASALLSEALVALETGEGSDILKTYIGVDHHEIRLELARVTTEFLRALDNVHYVYPGPDCHPGVYLYVHVDKPPRHGGVFHHYLCKPFMDSGPFERYFALLETGLHQKEMLAETATLHGQPVYGKVLVKQLAAKCAAEGLEGKGGWCEKSVRNSQSIIFTLGELARLAM